MIIIYYPIYYRCKILFDYYPYYIYHTNIQGYSFSPELFGFFFHILWSSGGKEARYTWTAGGTWASPKGDPKTSKGKWKFQPWFFQGRTVTLLEINISHLGKRKIIFKYALKKGDMLIAWRVNFRGVYLEMIFKGCRWSNRQTYQVFGYSTFSQL